ncbi:CD209 antigen-like protein E isoform X4 [Anoplopoma fimbria]|uniref:CD209 antigen-like protein E isoform X4 n=1 Tax=Anoplopoma fimbria TaxID=229290 RepID=UPI0023ECD602|nr:CD209 antigen-like protein E isoform X4 [Anoplopoma fimbria]
MEEIYANVEYAQPVDSNPLTNQTAMKEIYVNAEYEKSQVSSKPSRTHTGPSSSEIRSHRAVVLSLGLLSVFLLAGLVGLGVHYHDSVRGSAADLSTIKANLTERLRVMDDKLSSVSEERDQLNDNLTKVTKEMERLQLSSQQRWILFSSSCYLLSEESASWDESRQDCRDKGSDLVIVDTLEEQEFLSSIIRKLTWIGLSDRDNEGTWIWIDGTPLSDTVKYWNEPPNNGGGHPQSGEQDCVQIVVRRNPRGNWNDLRCDKSRQWICEKLA